MVVYKMSGSGNDFVMVDARTSSPAEWSAEDIRRVCTRGTGIGADGLVFVGPAGGHGKVRMIYFNSDGSPAAMCGNAALCSARLAVFLNLADPDAILLETDAGAYQARAGAQAERAELSLSRVAIPTAPQVTLAVGEDRAGHVIVGVPHLVVIVPDVAQLDLAGRGRALRFDEALAPEGANVNFVSPSDGDETTWHMRTYERGVEAETLACGTGAVAAACCVDTWGLSALPLTIMTRSGLPLIIRARSNGASYEDVWLEGEARMVFRGVTTT